MELQKAGNFFGPGLEVVKRDKESPKSERCKKPIAGKCRMR